MAFKFIKGTNLGMLKAKKEVVTDIVFTFVDHLTKMAHLVPTVTTVDAKEATDLCVRKIRKSHNET